MHGLQGAEAQGPTLERGPTGCREIIFFEYIYMGVCSSDNSIHVNKLTLIFSDTLVVVAYIVNGSV